jgi:hypothetical protein
MKTQARCSGTVPTVSTTMETEAEASLGPEYIAILDNILTHTHEKTKKQKPKHTKTYGI